MKVVIYYFADDNSHAVFNSTRERLLDIYKVAERKIPIIGINLCLTPQHKRQQVRRRDGTMSISQDISYLLNDGQMRHYKNDIVCFPVGVKGRLLEIVTTHCSKYPIYSEAKIGNGLTHVIDYNFNNEAKYRSISTIRNNRSAFIHLHEAISHVLDNQTVTRYQVKPTQKAPFLEYFNEYEIVPVQVLVGSRINMTYDTKSEAVDCLVRMNRNVIAKLEELRSYVATGEAIYAKHLALIKEWSRIEE